jgi:hypothetical protein
LVGYAIDKSGIQYRSDGTWLKRYDRRKKKRKEEDRRRKKEGESSD